MATAKSTDDLAYLMAKDDLSSAELERLFSYVPKEKMPALLGQILFNLCTSNAIA